MDKDHAGTHVVPSDVRLMQMDIPMKMFVACAISSVIGIVLMAVIGHTVLMAVFIVLFFVCVIDVPLVFKRIMSVETASLIPMLILCFLYTPLSWFTFGGPARLHALPVHPVCRYDRFHLLPHRAAGFATPVRPIARGVACALVLHIGSGA